MRELKLCKHGIEKCICQTCYHEATERTIKRLDTVCPHDVARWLYCADCSSDARSMRACGDCMQYVRVKDMIKKSDGRVICPGCQKAIDSKARERAQADLFVTQPALF